MAPPGAHVPLRFLRAAIKKGIELIKHKLTTPSSGKILAQLQPALVHNAPSSTRPIDRIKASKRWYTTHVRRLLDAAAINPYPAHLTGKVSSRVSSHVGRTASAFGTTLRPSLAGGALPRTAGGYSLGGSSARYFSHGAVAPAEVVSQVSSAMRTFILSGNKGLGGYNRSRTTANTRPGVRAQLAAEMNGDKSGGGGAWVDFDMSPTFTSLSHFRGGNASSINNNTNLNQPTTMELLSQDFATIVSDAAAVLRDIKKLATLGDLPVSLASDKSDTIRVHFAGCDKATVERLCLELGVMRGVVAEAADNHHHHHHHHHHGFAFELLMPQLDFSVHSACPAGGVMMPSAAAPQQVDWMDMLSTPPAPSSPSALHESLSQSDEGARWLSGLSSIDGAAYYGDVDLHSHSRAMSMTPPVEDVSVGEAATPSSSSSSSSSEGSSAGADARGIHAFLEQCEDYSRGAAGPVWT